MPISENSSIPLDFPTFGETLVCLNFRPHTRLCNLTPNPAARLCLEPLTMLHARAVGCHPQARGRLPQCSYRLIPKRGLPTSDQQESQAAQCQIPLPDHLGDPPCIIYLDGTAILQHPLRPDVAAPDLFTHWLMLFGINFMDTYRTLSPQTSSPTTESS